MGRVTKLTYGQQAALIVLWSMAALYLCKDRYYVDLDFIFIISSCARCYVNVFGEHAAFCTFLQLMLYRLSRVLA